nr:cytosine permease [Bacillus subtilis]
MPLGQEKRTWKAMNFASIWMGCIHNIPTYATVGGLIAIGFRLGRCWRSLLRHAYPIWRSCLKRYHAGTKYGPPFPVIIRASYGIYGANIPALLRAFTAIMWLGIQTFAGKTALNILLLNMCTGWGEIGDEWNILGIHLSGLLSFVFFLGHSFTRIASRHGVD